MSLQTVKAKHAGEITSMINLLALRGVDRESARSLVNSFFEAAYYAGKLDLRQEQQQSALNAIKEAVREVKSGL